jgi:hypothetical protein
MESYISLIFVCPCLTFMNLSLWNFFPVHLLHESVLCMVPKLLVQFWYYVKIKLSIGSGIWTC